MIGEEFEKGVYLGTARLGYLHSQLLYPVVPLPLVRLRITSLGFFLKLSRLFKYQNHFTQLEWNLRNPNWLTVPKEKGTSKNYKQNLIILLPCTKNEFLWNMTLCVNGPASLGGERCNPVTAFPESGV
jgi:hypothetical protein